MVVPARHRSHASYGIGDELRASFVTDGTYWGAAAFLRDGDQPWFTEDDVRFLAQLAEPIAEGLRRAVVHAAVTTDVIVAADGPGVVVFDEKGRVELISPATENWIDQIVEDPPPALPAESKRSRPSPPGLAPWRPAPIRSSWPLGRGCRHDPEPGCSCTGPRCRAAPKVEAPWSSSLLLPTRSPRSLPSPTG